MADNFDIVSFFVLRTTQDKSYFPPQADLPMERRASNFGFLTIADNFLVFHHGFLWLAANHSPHPQHQQKTDQQEENIRHPGA
ncbi:MAG: hypothetical protein WC299_16475, partial [Kiritimatiellia bacterium]